MESPAIWALFDHSPAASYYKGTFFQTIKCRFHVIPPLANVLGTFFASETRIALLLPEKADVLTPKSRTGQIAMLGDAAHASTPHLSAGAGQGTSSAP